MTTVATTSPKPVLSKASGNRFPAANRLLNAASFGRVFKNATRSRDRLFTVLCRTSSSKRPRLGLAISKKHCRLATRRNRIKRTIRESFRQHLLPLSGLDIVVINQPAATTADSKMMRDSLKVHWQRCTDAKKRKYEEQQER